MSRLRLTNLVASSFCGHQRSSARLSAFVNPIPAATQKYRLRFSSSTTNKTKNEKFDEAKGLFSGDLGKLREKFIETFRLTRTVNSTEFGQYFNDLTTRQQLESSVDLLKLFRVSAAEKKEAVIRPLLSTCLRVGAPDLVVTLIQNKAQYGLFPSPASYASVLDSLLEKRPLDKETVLQAATLFKQSQEDCIERTPLLQSLGIIALGAMPCKSHCLRIKAILVSFHADKDAKLFPVAYESAMWAFLNTPKAMPQQAIDAYNLMKECGITIGDFAFNLFIMASTRRHGALKGIELLSEMVKNRDPKEGHKIEHYTLGVMRWRSVSARSSTEKDERVGKFVELIKLLQQHNLIVKSLDAAISLPIDIPAVIEKSLSALPNDLKVIANGGNPFIEDESKTMESESEENESK